MDWPHIEIARPAWLAALMLLPVVVHYGRRSLARLAPWRRRATLALRSLVVIAIVLALCGVRVVKPTGEPFVVVAVDRSASISEAGQQAAKAFVDQVVQAAGNRGVAMIDFAAAPARAGDGTSGKHRGGTNLARAIELAAAMLPADRVPQIVLLSDGNPTAGDAIAAARSSRAPIATVPLASASDPEVYLEAVEAPCDVQDGQPFSVDVTIRASRAGEGVLELYRGGNLDERRPIKLRPGENRERFAKAVRGKGCVEFRAEIKKARDALPENNTQTALVLVRPRPRVLLVESRELLAGRLTEALQQQRIDVEARLPEGLPKSIDDLAGYELLVLSNVPAAALSADQMDLIDRYVRQYGGGLIAIGGDQAFTPGGYRKTRLEEVLPVWCEARKEQEKPRLAMVLVIDCSDSMKGQAIELAKEATRRAVAALDEKDQVGVIAFAKTCRWVSPIRPCTDKASVVRAIDTLATSYYGTDMYPAMDRACLALDDAFAEVKHMIVLTDGVSHPGDFEGVARRAREAGITISTVGVGREIARPLLEQIARIGEGHFYHPSDMAEVPQIFALEAASASKVGIVEKPFFARLVGRAQALQALDFQQAPSLLGYVQTRAKPSSQVVLASEDGDPVLVWWRYGQGVSVAFTSDIESRWAAAWLRWPGFGRFWSQLVRHAMRRDAAEDFALRVASADGLAEVTLDAVDADERFLNNAQGELVVLNPTGGRLKLPLRPTAPGRYAATFPARSPGRYGLEIALSQQGETVVRQQRALVAGYPEEYRTQPVNHDLLRQIAEVSGGVYNPDPATLFAESGRTVPRTIPLWPYFLAAGAVMLVVELAVRRASRAGPKTPRKG